MNHLVFVDGVFILLRALNTTVLQLGPLHGPLADKTRGAPSASDVAPDVAPDVASDVAFDAASLLRCR